MPFRYCLAGFALLCSGLAWAASQVQVVGLFPGAAVLNVDGQRKLVRVGQTGEVDKRQLPITAMWAADWAVFLASGKLPHLLRL